ncbi:ATP-binding protein [Clostridium butyricum]|uniref:ATP-binding protein n=1 Tax=Clostridium butyricum TaxID=1492 RepID=UPI00374E7C8E
MKTIRGKFSLIFIVSMCLLIMSSILLNIIFLERYYIYKNKYIFINTILRVQNQYVDNAEEMNNLLAEIDNNDNISCILADENLNVQYNSFPKKDMDDLSKPPKKIQNIILKNKKNLSDTYVYTVLDKDTSKVSKLVFISKMENGYFIILRKSMKGIRESALIANQFYAYSGIIIILIGSMFVFVLSKKIVKPIKEISDVAKNIANFNFDKYVTYEARDEIGLLSKSINKMSDKLQNNMNNLKSDIERRKQLVRNISHELKTPIGVIKGYSEGLKYGLADDQEKIEKYCTILADECDRINFMIHELLNLSMMESEYFIFNSSKFSINELINNIINRFDAVFSKNNISISVNFEEELFIYGDYKLLDIAINNYMTNAINNVDENKFIEITTKKINSSIRISIFNSGNHIDEKELKNIWDVFYKVDKSRSRESRGHGLGLSIVKTIIELHGGTAGAENVENGVLFFIELE